jgi:hypothetical protein
MSEFLLSNLLSDGCIYQFDKYQKAYKAESSRNPGPTATTPVARTTSSSLIERATQERRAREQNTTNDMRAELTRYLAENLLIINYADSPEHQAEVILQWWKVGHSAAGLPVLSSSSSPICSYCRTTLLTIRCSAVLHSIIYLYRDHLFHASAFFPMRASQIRSAVRDCFLKTSVPFRLSRASTRRSGDAARHKLMQNEWQRRTDGWMTLLRRCESRSQWRRRRKFSR